MDRRNFMVLFVWVFWWWGVFAWLVRVVWLRVCVSFRPVSASSLNPLLGV